MSSSFVGKEVTVRWEHTEEITYSGECLVDDETGITLRRPYRKGVRIEKVPRELVRGIYHTEEKGRRRVRKGTAPVATAPDETEFEEDTFEDEPDLGFDEEGFDDDDE
jgi:hypothetical protein